MHMVFGEYHRWTWIPGLVRLIFTNVVRKTPGTSDDVELQWRCPCDTRPTQSMGCLRIYLVVYDFMLMGPLREGTLDSLIG
jgi:hypothetical protein